MIKNLRSRPTSTPEKKNKGRTEMSNDSQEDIEDKRKSKRIPFNKSVHYGHDFPPDRISIVTDLSKGGVFIKSKKMFDIGTRVFMAIRIGEQVFEAEGVVTWINNEPPSIVKLVRNGMGIQFETVDKRLIEVYNKNVEVVAIIEPITKD